MPSPKYILVLTEAQIGTLRSAIATASMEDCGHRIRRIQDEVLVCVDNSRKVTPAAWSALDHAIGNSLSMDPEDVLPDAKTCKSALDLWRWLARRFDPAGATARS